VTQYDCGNKKRSKEETEISNSEKKRETKRDTKIKKGKK
jgi:hypothetical protein